MNRFIKLGLLLSALLIFAGCGSEAPGAYDDTKPNAIAFKEGELVGKKFEMMRGSTKLILEFTISDYKISSSTNLDLDWGEYSINDDGTVTLGTLNYKREAIISDTHWELYEREDSNADGEWERSQLVTWSIQTLAFSANELYGQEVYIFNEGTNEKRTFGLSSYTSDIYSGDDRPSISTNYSINEGSIVTQWGDVYTRVAIYSNRWSVEKSHDFNGDRIVDRKTIETWYTQEPSNFYE